jgi:hypothetical protein
VFIDAPFVVPSPEGLTADDISDGSEPVGQFAQKLKNT